MALRSGAEYLESLRDDREIWLAGERVADVTAHPSLAGCAGSVADVYDLQRDAAYRDVLTIPSPTGDGDASTSYLLPHTREDLVKRRRMAETLARRNGGVAARLPAHLAALVVGLYDARQILEDADPTFAANVSQYFTYCCEADPCIAPGFSDPPRDRSLPAERYENFRVVERRVDGMVVRGVKSVATLAPYANEFLALTPQRPGMTPAEITYFSSPIDAHGIRMVCREPLSHALSPEHRLSAHHDEMDAWLVFNDVFIPRERIFFLDHPERNGELFSRVMLWASYDNLVRMAVKAEVLAGICVAITDYLGIARQPMVEAGIVEAIVYAETLWAFVHGAERQAFVTAGGLLAPNPSQVTLGRIHGISHQPAILQTVREVCGSGILMAPTEADLAHPEIGADLTRFLVGQDERAPDRFRLLKLAWEYACDSFGSRQLLFEMNNESNLAANRTRLLTTYDTAPLARLAKSLAGIEDR